MKGRKLTVKERAAAIEAKADERRKIFKELCSHVAGGYSVASFPELSETSIRDYLNRFKDEFIQEELDLALRRGRVMWEGIGKRQADGQCLGNSRSWYYNMANRYGWREKIDIEAEHKGSIEVQVVSYASKKRSTNAVSEVET